MDSRLIALKHLKGKQDLIDEFTDFYTELMHDLNSKEDWQSLRAAREMLDEQVTFVTDLALSCEDAPPGNG